MKTYTVVGGGIAGLMTAWFLHKKNRLEAIYQPADSKGASSIAAGIINPITGKRFAKTWIADTLFPFAEKTYQEIEQTLGISFFSSIEVMRLAETMEQENDWHARTQSDSFAKYISTKAAPENINHLLQPIASSFFIKGGYKLAVETLSENLLSYFKRENKWVNEPYNANETNNNVIFCSGMANQNTLPVIGVKGHYLVCDIPDLAVDFVVHGHATIIPQKDGLYRVGSTYQWAFENDEIEKIQVDFLTSGLKKTLCCDFTVIDALAGIRPTTADRRPIVGCIDIDKNHFTLNGLGTKGYSLAPYFADMLVNHLTEDSPIIKEVRANR